MFSRLQFDKNAAFVEEKKNQPLQQEQGDGQKNGLEGREQVCRPAEDALVEGVDVEKLVNQVGRQRVQADNAQGERPYPEFPDVYDQMEKTSSIRETPAAASTNVPVHIFLMMG